LIMSNKNEHSPNVLNPHPRIPVYVETATLDVLDPARVQVSTVWQGSNHITFKLLRCVEAVRDLTKLLESIPRLEQPLGDKRFAKILATPLYNLACGILDLFNEIESNAKEYSSLSATERNQLSERKNRFMELVPTEKGSDLREVRNRMSSHIDKDAVMLPSQYWSKVDIAAFFRWLALCLIELMHLLDLDIYSWTRDSKQPSICSLMTIDGSVVNLYMQNGDPVGIQSFTFAKSPKYEVAREIEGLVSLYNTIAANVDDHS